MDQEILSILRFKDKWPELRPFSEQEVSKKNRRLHVDRPLDEFILPNDVNRRAHKDGFETYPLDSYSQDKKGRKLWARDIIEHQARLDERDRILG